MSARRTGLVLALILAAPLGACSTGPTTQPSTAPTPFAGAVEPSEAAPSSPDGPSDTVSGAAPAGPADAVSPESSGEVSPAETPSPTETQTQTQTQTVTLGITDPLRGTGFGSARPARIALGGDPMGELTDIRWESWGGETAVGHGTGWYAPEGRPLAESVHAPATIRAFGLTTCADGRRYRHVEWWFPTKGETAPTTPFGDLDLCERAG